MKKLILGKISIALSALLASNAVLAVTTAPPVSVSEPGTFALLAAAITVMAIVHKKRK
ncbi:PEP-CTERM sorting domain-containing protein [Dasania marina]|uniref:PEP-CTERM sorting domain-containing protein n=1 Tax=Dasania marina TaxID=471499 RepID=UPI0004BCCA1D|nr:PEP-CTERM sorting domain-containing protein [Dasania marina]